MKKIILVCVALLAIFATIGCKSVKRVTLSNKPICAATFVKAEIIFRADSANYIRWHEPVPFDCQPLVEYLCKCRLKKEPIKFLSSFSVTLYDGNNNKYHLGFSAIGRALKADRGTYRLSKKDACEIKKLLVPKTE